MSQNKVDYSKSLIYKIVCNDTNIKNVYIGSTTNFTNRKRQHKCSCNTETTPLYKFIRENGGWDNFDMILVDYVPCETKLELHKIEREYIEKIQPALNHNSAYTGLTQEEYFKEYYEDNKETLKNYQKEYRKYNKEEINKKRREEKITCDICNTFITKQNLLKHKKTKKCLSHIKSV